MLLPSFYIRVFVINLHGFKGFVLPCKLLQITDWPIKMVEQPLLSSTGATSHYVYYIVKTAYC